MVRPTRIPRPHRCYIEKQFWVGKAYFGWAPGLVMGPCIVEIDRIVIREILYQPEVNQWRNEEVILKGNFGWVSYVGGALGWLMWIWVVEIDRVVLRDVQY
ncbi:hypothetical protein DPMN_035262 [Dreissena polymorpha]|uniref:Uncharacterized protein n=1 Tax=Dreissena polymorpha TaxID=45954 RepID=A0A9D4MA86_DREPO|nr:hypothetical protein DPMN_035262 [Dreissena polymorpha]